MCKYYFRVKVWDLDGYEVEEECLDVNTFKHFINKMIEDDDLENLISIEKENYK